MTGVRVYEVPDDRVGDVRETLGVRMPVNRTAWSPGSPMRLSLVEPPANVRKWLRSLGCREVPEDVV